MTNKKDPMLETDRLDELLEQPAIAQPVVVVEYRSRGVPSWVFFPLIFIIPLAAIVVYHRMVVERYRVQAAQANSLLVREINAERASLPLARNDPPPTTILPGTQPTATVVKPAPAPSVPHAVGSPVAPVAAAPVAPPAAPSVARSDSSPPVTVPAVNLPNSSPESDPFQTLMEPRTAVANDPPVAAASAPANVAGRSGLPNPLAAADAPRPPAPGEGANRVPVAGAQVNAPAAEAEKVVEKPARQAGAGGTAPQPGSEKTPAGGPALAMGQPAVVTPEPPLPTKEESLRQIQEEAARREAEILAQTDAKSAEARATRLAEQLKFRDELGELIRVQGKKAGPDIEALAKRYGYDSDPDRMARAIRIWWLTRKSQAEKVKAVRALDLPESVVLGFLFDDIFRTAGGRNGPQSNGEVRVLAAQQLLRYPLTKASPARAQAGNADGGNPAARSAAPARRTVVSTPR